MFASLKQDRSKYRKLLVLALPIVLQNLISSLVGMADTVMVGLMGQNELAGLTLANNLFTAINLMVFGIMSGGSVLMSQYWGKRDTASINRIYGIGLYVAGIFTFIFSAVIFIFPYQIMSITSNDVALVDISARYARIVAPTFFINGITMVYVAAQRSAENPRFGLIVLTVSCLTNVFLNWVLIFGKLGAPALGVEGAAIATLAARIVELIITLIHMLFIDKRLQLNVKLIFKPGIIYFKDFIKYSVPVVANEALWGLGVSVVPMIYGHMENSSDIVAALSVANNVEQIANVLIFAVAQAAAVIIGNEIGEGKEHNEVAGTGKWLLVMSGILGFVIGGIIIVLVLTVGKSHILPMFSLSENAMDIAVFMLVVTGITMCFTNYIVTLIVGVLRGGGAVKASMYLDVLPVYFYMLPLAFLLGIILKLDIRIIYLILKLEILIKFIPGMIIFNRKKWIRDLTR